MLQDAKFSAMCQQRLQDKPLRRNLIVTEQLNLQTFKNVAPKIYKVTHNSFYGKLLVLLSSFIHPELTFYFLFLLFFPLYFTEEQLHICRTPATFLHTEVAAGSFTTK